VLKKSHHPWSAIAVIAIAFGYAAMASAQPDGTESPTVTATAVSPEPFVSPMSPQKYADVTKRAERKKMRADKLQRFDRPREAVEFFVNKRTGPIITRGPRATKGARSLDVAPYLKAIEVARKTPGFSSRTGRVMSPDDTMAAMAAAPGASLATWEVLGPSNQGGRTRQLLIDPTNPNTMYTAAVGGGVWKTTTAGASWTQLTDLLLPNIAVAALAMNPSNPQVLYAGTGEGFFNGDAIRGAGVYKSVDGGTSWSPLAVTAPGGALATSFQYVTQIIVSPRAPQRVYATTRAGLYRSNDGGTSWTQLINGAAVNGCMDVQMQIKRAVGYVFAACGTFAQSTVYRGLDSASSTFAAVFSPAGAGRTSLAIAPSNESYVYALSASNGPGNYTDGLLGVYRSTANGNSGSWTTQVSNSSANKLNTLLLTNPVYAYAECVGPSQAFYNQGWYDNIISVDPADPNRVWVGGIDLFRSDDGGANWGLASYWWTKGDPTFGPNYAHADQHAIRFHPGYNGTTNKIMYVAGDGGIFRTDDARANTGKLLTNVCTAPTAGAVTWTELNTNYTTLQFYQGSVYPNGNTYFGGTQDNGTWRGTTGFTAWQNLLGGDGGYTAVDTKGDAIAANDVLFGAYTGLSIQRSTDGGASFSDAVTGITGDPGHLFIAPLEMNATNRQVLTSGGWYIWRTTDQANNWVQASAITAGDGSVSTIASAPTDSNRAIVGMSDGYVHYTSTFLSNTSATNWPQTRPRTVFVTSAAFAPSDANVAYITYATFSGASVYRSANGGATWTSVPGTGVNVLPAVPATAVAVDPSDPNRVYVGTDIGVYTSLDGGANWYKEVTGFGNVSVESLKINTEGAKYLYAFTHGRGAWRVAINP